MFPSSSSLHSQEESSIIYKYLVCYFVRGIFSQSKNSSHSNQLTRYAKTGAVCSRKYIRLIFRCSVRDARCCHSISSSLRLTSSLSIMTCGSVVACTLLACRMCWSLLLRTPPKSATHPAPTSGPRLPPPQGATASHSTEAPQAAPPGHCGVCTVVSPLICADVLRYSPTNRE